VILPEKMPEVSEGMDDIQVRVKKIHDVQEDEVSSHFGDSVLMVG
jgi:hypothetical protein